MKKIIPLLIFPILVSPLLLNTNQKVVSIKADTTYQGVIEEGRYFIITSKNSTLYGLQASASKPAQILVSYENTLSMPWRFRLVADDTYEIFFRLNNGNEYFLYYNQDDSSSLETNCLDVSTSPNHPYRWTITPPSTNNYRLSIKVNNTKTRYLCYKNSDSYNYWRGASSGISGYTYSIGLHSFETGVTPTVNAINNISCDNGKTIPSLDEWNLAKEAYTNMKSPAKRHFNMHNAVKDSPNFVESALAKYEYIIAKYGEEAFPNYMNREIKPLSYYGLNNTINNNVLTNTILISTLVVISVMSITLFIIKRKGSK